MPTPLDALFAHNWWANERILSTLHGGGVDRQPDAESLRLMAHVAAAEQLWYTRIQGLPPRIAVWPTLSLDEVAALTAETQAAYARLLAALDDAGLRRDVHYVNSAGTPFHNTVGDILTHVALHGHYHRGQIARQMRAAGLEPAYTDYIGWARREQG